MKILERTLPKSHRIYFSGDKHYGTILQHKKGIKKFIQTVKNDPQGYWVDMGDIAEGITVDDKRYCPTTSDPEMNMTLEQYEHYVQDHKPIADKCLAILEGNHDWKLGARVGSYVKGKVCKELGESIGINGDDLYGTYTCVVCINDKQGNLLYKMLLSHGFGNINSKANDPIRREANMKVSLKDKFRMKGGDCAISAMGHTHKLLVAPPTKKLYLTHDPKGKGHVRQHYTAIDQTAECIPDDLRWYVNTGSFYKLYEMGVSGYAERAGYDPVEIGYAVAHVKNGVIQDIERVIIGES